MSSQFQPQPQETQPVVVLPDPGNVQLPPQQHLLYGGIGFASICGVAILIREFRLLIKELRLLATK